MPGNGTSHDDATRSVGAFVHALLPTDSHSNSSRRQRVEEAAAEDSATENSDDPVQAPAEDSVTEDESVVEVKTNSGSETEDSVQPPPKKKAKTAPNANAKGKAKQRSTDPKRQRGEIPQESSDIEVTDIISKPAKRLIKRPEVPAEQRSNQKDKIGSAQGGGYV